MLRGVIVAVLATLPHLLWVTSQPRDALLGAIPGRDGLYKLHRHPDAAAIPGLTIYLPEAALVFFNAEYVKHRLLKSVTRTVVPPRWLVLDASAIGYLDTTAVDALEDARASLAARGIRLAIAGIHSRARRLIERSGLAARLGPDMIFHSAEDAAESSRRARPGRRHAGEWRGKPGLSLPPRSGDPPLVPCLAPGAMSFSDATSRLNEKGIRGAPDAIAANDCFADDVVHGDGAECLLEGGAGTAAAAADGSRRQGRVEGGRAGRGATGVINALQCAVASSWGRS